MVAGTDGDNDICWFFTFPTDLLDLWKEPYKEKLSMSKFR